MLLLEIAFWACVALIAYPYLLYPLLLAVLARLRPRPVRRGMDGPRSLSIVICAHNEAKNIERRLRELIGILHGTRIEGEIILVSDGSTDETANLARFVGDSHVTVLELPERLGKAEALSRGVAVARNAVVVFADVRQAWAPDALELLLENFADPAVGAVSGDLEVVSGPGPMAGVGLYWRYEKWLRRKESAVASQVGVTGAISAVRRELFRPILAGTLLDDVYWPLSVAMQGRRVVHDSRALAYDRLPERTRDEFRRKVRTLAGNFQLAMRLPAALLPWRNPVWFQFVSHKLLRLAVPWALLGLVACSIALDGPIYLLALIAQSAFYGLALVGLLTRKGRLPSAAASFLMLNAAAWTAFWVWITGRAGYSWQKVSYDSSRPPVPAPAAGEKRADWQSVLREENRTDCQSVLPEATPQR
jgi:cellulose synthase/poly-beta-1,6-N-acetylglucosamine synthase-like glycosyltransferase